VNPRTVDAALLIMDSTGFEDLVYALVHKDEPTARQLKPPDAGRDTVVALGDGCERAWQAKHHTAGIKWKDCEESLEAALDAGRKVREMTFVFPVNMTEGKERGLHQLREAFPNVEIPEPWTVGRLREQILGDAEICRRHIENIIGLDQRYAREMFERGLRTRGRWTEQTAAALRGPVSILGLEDAVGRAEDAADRGDWLEASRQMEGIAVEAALRMPAVADVLMLRAARYAGEARDRERAGRLYLDVSKSAARRGDDTAEYAAFRASWLLGEDERWRAHAAIARAAWPEHPEDSIEVLRAAFEQCVEAGDESGTAEWADACCDALAAQGDWKAIHDIATRAVDVLGPVTADRSRLNIELDLLEARAFLGEDTDPDFRQLLLTELGRDDATAAQLEARWGCVLARYGTWPDARLRFRAAARRWSDLDGSEDEVGEAVLSEDSASQLLGEGTVLDQPTRIAVAELRGRDVSAAVLADNKEAVGLRAWLNGSGHDARRALMTSWSIHRRAGHFGGCARLSGSLYALFERAEDWPEALTWAIRSGRSLKAKEAAERLPWAQVHPHLQPHGLYWERGASFEAVAVAGMEASDEQVRSLVEPLLAAGEEQTREVAAVRTGAAARRALSTLLCAVPAERFDAALEQVVYELHNTPFPPAVAVNGLLLATDAGLCDAAESLAEVFCVYDRMHVSGFSEALGLIQRSDASKAIVEERAADEFLALVVAAWMGLPDNSETLHARAQGLVTRSLAGELGPDELLRWDDRGRLARWASVDDQVQMAAALIGEMSNSADIDVHRYEAAIGLATLAEALPADKASDVLDDLLGQWPSIVEPSRATGYRSHPNVHFARVKVRTPRATGPLVAKATEAACQLAARCDRLAELTELISEGMYDADGAIRVEVLRLAHRWPALADVDFAALAADDAPAVRALALAVCDERGELAADELRNVADGHGPLDLRSAALGIARRAPETHRPTLERLADDPHVYIRSVARRALAA
jgi:hypothetical protein